MTTPAQAPSLASMLRASLWAQSLSPDAFARIEAARLAPVTYVTLVWGVLFGFLFFAEVPGPDTIAGAALIVLGTLVTQRR